MSSFFTKAAAALVLMFAFAGCATRTDSCHDVANKFGRFSAMARRLCEANEKDEAHAEVACVTECLERCAKAAR